MSNTDKAAIPTPPATTALVPLAPGTIVTTLGYTTEVGVVLQYRRTQADFDLRSIWDVYDVHWLRHFNGSNIVGEHVVYRSK